MDLDWKKHPHRRFNPLLREWVLVSPHRADRPWQGAVEKVEPPAPVPYDPTCYLCPGNERAGGVRNPRYASTFIFDNDFPALRPDTPHAAFDLKGLLAAETERGICRVGCFSPRHDEAIPRMEVSAITRVVDMWCDEYSQLGGLPFINHVQIFENRGQAMGASNPHPHCQIWANSSVPDLTASETASQIEYERHTRSCLLCEYAALERSSERVVCENESFLVVVPFWAVWPFETMVIGRRHVTGLDELTQTERTALADVLRKVTSCYDRIFAVPFPYSMGFHQRPTDGQPHRPWHMHAHFLPPLLRSAAIRKFMVGYELLAGPQRDLTAEMAAERLRSMWPPAGLDTIRA
jgi:UDPglucose--hexose-1-phosphate uridylyltransferase